MCNLSFEDPPLKTVLLSEPIEDAGIKLLEPKAKILISPDPSEASVGRLMEESDALIVRTATRITREMIEASL